MSKLLASKSNKTNPPSRQSGSSLKPRNNPETRNRNASLNDYTSLSSKTLAASISKSKPVKSQPDLDSEMRRLSLMSAASADLSTRKRDSSQDVPLYLSPINGTCKSSSDQHLDVPNNNGLRAGSPNSLTSNHSNSSLNKMRSRSPTIPHIRIDDCSSDDKVKFVMNPSDGSGPNEIVETHGIILGKGSFGLVCLGQDMNTGNKYAIKKVNKEKAGTMGLRLLEREVDILKRVFHPNIIVMHSIFETPKFMYLVLEHCDKGDLKKQLKRSRNGRFTEEETREIMNKLASAVHYLHKEAIVHRDLKLENVLCKTIETNPDEPEDQAGVTSSNVSQNGTDSSTGRKVAINSNILDFDIRLIDFGLSVIKDGYDSYIDTWVGTPLYMAPEVIKKTGHSHLCDVWSLGIIMHLLLSGSFPFYSENEDHLSKLICAANLKFNLQNPNSESNSSSAKFWNTISYSAKDLLTKMLHPKTSHRYSAGEVLDHAFLKGTAFEEEQRPSNVLEMMSAWARDISLEDEIGNEDQSNPGKDTITQSKKKPTKTSKR